MNTLGRFFTITAKGDNLVLPVDFPALLKRVHHSGSKFFPFKVDPIPEVGLFHSLILHRTLGKFHYKQEGSYSIGTLGFVDEDCDFIDFTYVRVASEVLFKNVRREVTVFSESLLGSTTAESGQISLEFYQRKRARWPFPAECIPWEVWTIKLDIISLSNEHQRQVCREKLGELLAEKTLYIADIMNRHEYVPKMPNQSELDLIFDTTYIDVQPYLHRISHQINGPSSSSVSTTMRKFLKDTLAL